MTMKAGIALGSNLEPRLLNLQAARRRIFELHRSTAPIPCSKVYETSPIDCPEGSAPFLNAVLEITTNLAPEEILHRLQAIENDLGRPSEHARNAPRTIDLDLLYCDNLTLSTPELTLPHPRIHERLFVLKPLSDIRPGLVLPDFSKTVEELLHASPSDESVIEFCNTIY